MTGKGRRPLPPVTPVYSQRWGSVELDGRERRAVSMTARRSEAGARGYVRLGPGGVSSRNQQDSESRVIIRLPYEIEDFAHLDGLSSFTLPNNEHGPSHSFQLSYGPRVSFLRSRKFIVPELGLAGGNLRYGAASVLMPETPMDKYGQSMPGKYNVRTSRQIATMQSKAIASTMQELPHRDFWRGILAAKSPHQLTASLGVGAQHNPPVTM